jgi:hypothetical protein
MGDARSTTRATEGEEVTAGAVSDHTAAALGGGRAKVLRTLVREHRHEGGMHASEITAETPRLHRA